MRRCGHHLEVAVPTSRNCHHDRKHTAFYCFKWMTPLFVEWVVDGERNIRLSDPCVDNMAGGNIGHEFDVIEEEKRYGAIPDRLALYRCELLSVVRHHIMGNEVREKVQIRIGHINKIYVHSVAISWMWRGNHTFGIYRHVFAKHFVAIPVFPLALSTAIERDPTCRTSVEHCAIGFVALRPISEYARETASRDLLLHCHITELDVQPFL